MTTADTLLQAPDGAIQCLACGAVLPSGARPGGHRADCPTAAAEAARLVLGGSAASLARQLYREAGSAATARAVAGQLRDMASELYALIGAEEPRR